MLVNQSKQGSNQGQKSVSLSKQILDQKNLNPKKRLAPKNFGSKKILIEKYFGSDKFRVSLVKISFLVQQKFRSNKNGSTKILGQGEI